MAELPSIFMFSSNQYLIPDIEPYNSSYHKKYELALINDGELFINDIGGFFSRIYKKNGCHRYYITYITETTGSSMGDSDPIFYKFSSTFIGTDLKVAMRTFISDDIYTRDDDLEIEVLTTCLSCAKHLFNKIYVKKRSEKYFIS